MSSANFYGGDYSAARDININITNVPKATDEDKKIAHWFSRLNFWTTYQDTLGRRHQGTGSWFLQHEKIVNWQQGGHRTLLCTGIPGSGKSVLSAIVTEHLLRSRMKDETIAVGCIYCNYKDRQSAVNLLSSLVKQFLQQIPIAPDRIKSIFEDHNGRQTQPALNEYYDILQSVSDQFRNVFLVIDALDECDKNDSKSLIKVLAKVSAIRLLVFSRDVPYVKYHFSDCPHLEIQASESDIESYLDARIRDEVELAELIREPPTLYDRIRATIVDKSRGMFLLAHLHLESLCEHDNRGAICTALDSLPTELYVSYEEAINRIKKQSNTDCLRAKQVLLWISSALRPLKVDELREALAVQSNSTTLDRETLPIESRLISICAGLVRIDQQSRIIKLAHETIQKYLELKRSDLFPDADQTIATACLTYLSFDTFEVGVCSTDQELEDLLRQNTFLEYASRYWAIHTRGELEKDFTELSLRFLLNDLKVACSSQVMLADSRNLSGYSQMVPWKVLGTHIGAHFNLVCTLTALLRVCSDLDAQDSNGRTPLSWAASLGNNETVLLLMNQECVSVNSEDRHGQTPLSRAAEEGLEAVVKLLVQHKDIIIDCRDEFGMTPLAWAVNGGHPAIIKILLDNGASVDTADNDGETAFYKAVEKRNEDVIRLLLQERVHIPEDNNCGVVALDWAAENRHWEIISLLKKRGVNLNEKVSPGTTVLTKAVANGRRDTVEFLVKTGAMINPKKAHDLAPLWTAVTHGHYGMLETLLELEADANVKDQQGRTLLLWAVESGRADLLPVLVAYGANIDATNKSGQTVLWTAMENDRADLVSLLVRLGANIKVSNKTQETILHSAVTLGKFNMIQTLKECGANFEATDLQERTPLRYAVDSGSEKAVTVLVSLGANIEAKDLEGKTPFRSAIESDCKMMQVLARLGSDKDAEDKFGHTALHWAAKNDRAEAVRELVSLGVNVEAKNSSGQTPLHLAAESGHREVVETLIGHGINLDTRDASGRTSLLTAALSKHLKVVEVLLQAGANESIADLDGQRPYRLAIESRGSELLNVLFASKCKLETRLNQHRWSLLDIEREQLRWFVANLARTELAGIAEIFEGYTPLHVAARKGYPEIVDALLRTRWFSAAAKLSNGRTPIHLATHMGHLDIVERLLAEDCVGVNDQTDSGMVPLHIAAQLLSLEMLNYLLLQEDVIADIKTNEGFTPLHLAAQEGLLWTVKRLLRDERVSADVKSKDGRTPAQLAYDNGHFMVADEIRAREGVVEPDASQCKPLISIHLGKDDGDLETSAVSEWQDFFNTGAHQGTLHGFIPKHE